MENKFKFLKLRVKQRYGSGDQLFDWFEWFCLSETWVHPYNRGNAKAKEFQQWCQDVWQKAHPDGAICPDVKIDGEKLNDGYGSDVTGRICSYFGHDEESALCDAMDESLADGKTRKVEFKNDNVTLTVEVTPYESISPDPESFAEFGPYEDDARAGLWQAKSPLDRAYNRTMKTTKEKLDEAVGAAWAALMKSLADNGVEFEDSDSGCYVDDAAAKKTYTIDIKLVECDDYGGES